MADDTFQAHPVRSDRNHFCLGDVGNNVWREVAGRVMDFVEQLLFDRGCSDAAPGQRWLEDRAVARAVDFGNGIPQAVHVRYIFVPGVCEIAARDLGSTFQQMPGHRGSGQAIPVIPGPAEVGHGRSHHK